MLREVIQLGNPILRVKALDVQAGELRTQVINDLITDMMETMVTASGMGIAAPQVGESLRIFIVASKPNARYPQAPIMKPTVMVNPVLEWASSETVKAWEGCLSIPGIRGLVPRAREIRVRFTDPATSQEVIAEYQDFVARVWLHENDHLDGLMFLDRAAADELISDHEYHKLIAQQSETIR